MRTKLKITEGIFPMPVLMVATYNEDGSVNVMNAAWGTMQERDTVALNLTETHIRCQQTAGIRYESAVPGVVIALWVNKDTVCSIRIEDEQAVPGIIIVLNGVFVLCDEIIIHQQGTAELLKPLDRQLDDLVHNTGFAFVLRLLSLQFCLNDHAIPPISIWLL